MALLDHVADLADAGAAASPGVARSRDVPDRPTTAANLVADGAAGDAFAEANDHRENLS